MPFTLDLAVVQPILTRVSRLFGTDTTDAILLYAGRRVGAKAEELVSPYPTASRKPLALYYTRQRKDGSTYKSKFKSLAQQRKVMALAKSGAIPYRRTGTLGRSILSEADLAGLGLVIVRIGSKLSYAPYVIDLQMQSHYHIGTWIPIQTDVIDGIPQLVEVAISSVVQEVQRRGSAHG